MATSIFVATAAELLAGDAIDLQGIVKVIGTDPVTADGLLPIVTEDFAGSQYVDYVDPQRQFTIVRTES